MVESNAVAFDDGEADARLPQDERRAHPPARTIAATPYRCRPPDSLPLRPWIYGRQLLRGSLSVIVAPGGVGKTALLVGSALALTTSRPLLGKQTWGGPKRVWLWNLEDSALELSYLIEAARLHWKISEEDLADRLFVDSGLEGAELCIATEENGGFRIHEPVVDALVDELISRRIDVLKVDPFVSSHRVSENNNTAIDAIAKKWARVAVRANCAVLLVHHTRKSMRPGDEANAEAGRGAVALPNAARSVLALNRMSEPEARSWGVERQERRRYFRAYDDKPNRAPPAASDDWYHLASVSLGNDSDGAGDSIQVVLPWTPPDAFTGVTADHLRQVQEEIGRCDWKENSQAKEWAGIAVADVLDLDLDDPDQKERIKKLLKGWVQSGSLQIQRAKVAGKGRDAPFVRVGTWAEPDGPRL